MKRTANTFAALAFVAAMMNPSIAVAKEKGRHRDDDKNDGTTAAVIGGIAAIGIIAAIASKKKKHGNDYRYDNEWDTNYYGEPFSPAGSVICVPNQRKCFDRGNFSYSWTKRIFGTSAGFGGSGDSFGGSGSSVDLIRAEQSCIERGRQRGLRNITVDAVRPEGAKRARVFMQTRRSQASVNTERWRCEYRFNSGKTEFKRI